MEGERSIELFVTEDSTLNEEKIGIETLERCSRNLLSAINFKKGFYSAGIKVCDSDSMVEMHKFYMDDASDTDVMAFPSSEDDNYLGDIIVCEDVATKCAEEFSNNFKAEIQFYCLHGLLHLLGYEDDTEEKKNEMLVLQKDALILEGIEINI